MVRNIEALYGEEPLRSKDYGKIVNSRHYDRLAGLLAGETPYYFGGYDEAACKIGPVILDDADWNSSCMQEEIFGPVLPVLTFENLREVKDRLDLLPRPLALYLFTRDKSCLLYTSYCQKEGGFYPAVVFCSVIKAGDGLKSLRNADGYRKNQLIDFHNDAGAGKGNRLTVDTQSAVIGKRIVQYNLHCHHGKLVDVYKRQVIETALGGFLDFVEDRILVGHNIHAFDMKFIKRDAARLWGKTVGNDYIRCV